MKVQDIKKVGVVGAGVMGHGIAVSSAVWGYPTTVHDVNDAILNKAMKGIESTLDIFIEAGLIDRKRANETKKRITLTTDLDKLAKNSDFITEAIVERSEDKRILFKKLDELCPPHTILASNTSTLVLSDFGRDAKRQDKLVVTHYFSPPAIVPGVEVAKGPGTTQETFDITVELMKKWYKFPIKILKERPSYLINRLQNALNREAMLLWAEGVASAEDIDYGVRATMGYRMPCEGPLARYDYAGLYRWPKDVLAHMADMILDGLSQPTPETRKKIVERETSGKTWFINPDKFDEEIKPLYRDYAQRLKGKYWPVEK